MNNLKDNNNYNYIKSYFAFVLMVFAVFSGSSVNTVLESTEGARSLDFHSVRTSKIIQYNDYVLKFAAKHKLHLLSSKTKPNAIDFLKSISSAVVSRSMAIIVTITVMSLLSLFIHYDNNCLTKNSIWLGAVY